MQLKGWLLLAILQVLVVTALLARAGSLLLLSLPILVFLAVGYWLAPRDLDLSAVRRLNATSLRAGEQVEVKLIIRNDGRERAHLRLHDCPISSPGHGLPADSRMLTVSSGETGEIKYSFNPRRGIYRWQGVRVQAFDPLGLFSLEILIPAPGKILVRPDQMDIRNAPFPSRAGRLSAGSIPATHSGAGVEYFGVRQHAPGDSRRRINWRLSARHPGEMYTNEFEAEQIAEIGVVLDARRLCRDHEMEEDLFESRVSAAASLCLEYKKYGNRVSLLVFGKSMSVVFPGAGKHHSDQILRKLAGASLDAYVPFEYLDFYLTSRLFSGRSQIIILSELDSRDLPTYAALRARDFEVSLLSPNPVEYRSVRLPDTELNDLAVQAARLERIKLLQQLQGFGIEIIDWPIHQPLPAAAESAIQNRRRRVRSIGALK